MRTGLWVTIAAVAALVLTGCVDRSGDGDGDGAKPASPLARAADERDTVLEAAEQGATTLNTLDYRHADAGYDEWESVSTGSLLDEIKQGRDQNLAAIEKAKSVSEATVLTSAVSELDGKKGTATVLVAMRVEISTPEQDGTTKFLRERLRLQRTGTDWKTAEISQVQPGS
jgi:Mce-associated membrane protein